MYKEYDGHRDPTNYSYASTSTSSFDDVNVPAIHVYGLTFDNKENNIGTIKIPGRVFLAPVATPYYHAIMDVIGEYEFIKNYFPDTKIIFCSNDNMHELRMHRENHRSKFIDDILGIYFATNKVIDLNNYYVEFEEVVFFPNRSMWTQDRMVPLAIQNSIKEFGRGECVERRPRLVDYIKNAVGHFRKDGGPAKIYSARMSLNDMSVREGSRGYKDEKKIIDYFVSKGYTPVNLVGLSLMDQINLFYNATHVAGLKGSNIFNSIFCKPGTKVIQIYSTNLWDYEFEDYFKPQGIEVIDVAREFSQTMNLDGLEYTPADVIINELNTLDDI